MVVIVYLVRHSWFVFCFFLFIYIVLLLPLIVVNKASCVKRVGEVKFDYDVVWLQSLQISAG